jgi:ligand-binding sensor domain-containing protein
MEMKKIDRFSHILFYAVILSILLSFTACENPDEELLDPDTAGVWTLYNSANSRLPGNEIRDLAVDETGNLWASCYGSGLAKYSGGEWTSYTSTNSGLLSNNVTAIETTPNGSVIVGTSNGVSILNSSGIWSSYKDPLVSIMNVYSVRQTSDGSLWVGTYNEGLYINTASIYSHTTSGLTVYCFEEDKDGNIWMGTNTGLAIWNGVTWSTLSGLENLPAGAVSALYIDSRDRVWIGVLDDPKIYCYENSTLRGISLMTGLTNIKILDISEDRSGDIWIATYGGGLIRYDGVVPHSYKSYNQFTSEVFAEDDVNCIVRDNDGNMWFGLTTKGLVKYTLPLN